MQLAPRIDEEGWKRALPSAGEPVNLIRVTLYRRPGSRFGRACRGFCYGRDRGVGLIGHLYDDAGRSPSVKFDVDLVGAACVFPAIIPALGYRLVLVACVGAPRLPEQPLDLLFGGPAGDHRGEGFCAELARRPEIGRARRGEPLQADQLGLPTTSSPSSWAGPWVRCGTKYRRFRSLTAMSTPASRSIVTGVVW